MRLRTAGEYGETEGKDRKSESAKEEEVEFPVWERSLREGARSPSVAAPSRYLVGRPAQLGHPVVNQIKSGYYNGKNPQTCRSTNRQADPEVWFRIVHLAQDAQSGAPVAAYREQTVEIALGPKGTFENGNIGTLTRRAPPGKVVSAVPPGRGDPKQPRVPKTPRVVELLRKAIEWKDLLESGKIANQAEIAHQEGITRSRVTHIMGMLRLAPEIQEKILVMPDAIHKTLLTERVLRPIGTITNYGNQIREFHKLLG